jgi:aryl-alcohol dehydrogenase-like predicted oxidoreductase
MDYRTLGNSGCAVSSLCLGTMTFGVEADETVAHQQLDRFVEAGGTLVDTADVYGDGRSEQIVGRWFARRPAEVTEPVVLATKGRFNLSGDNSPNGAGLSARHLTRALDASLRRLGLDTVDLYQVHAFDALTPMEETLRTLDQFVRAGKIRYYGLSNFTGWQLTKAVHLARALNVTGPCSTPGWACCRGARSAAAGCPASTAVTSARPARPASVRIPAAAWRPTTGAARTGPGTSSTQCRRWPRTAACPWPRSRWPG